MSHDRRLVAGTGAAIVPLTAGRAAVTGTAAEVTRFLDRARRDGVLLHASDMLPTGERGVFVVTARLAQVQRWPAPPSQPPWRQVDVLVPTALLAATGLVGVGLLWTFLAMVVDMAREIASAAAVAALAALIAWMLLGQAGRCPGIHCPGCRCG